MKIPSYAGMKSFIFFLIAALYILTCVNTAAGNSDPLEQLTNSHTRVVWIQEQGKGADTYGFGQNFKLMGYDSRDGKNERALLPDTENFYKPILTPDGKNVVVSSRTRHEIYLVDFNTGKRKNLGKGVAVDVWKNQSTGKTWVYAVSGDGSENKYLTTHPLIRFPLKKPKKRQLIWKKTHLSWSNFDLSRDGKFAGGLFPWPHAGILIFEENIWKKYGKGCWTALSPDNSAILWVFDGLHRNLNFVNPFTAQFWTTNINNGPGIEGFEVYHPRWSNHVRFLTMTGPYVEGEGGNKINGGGEKVEIHVGKFSADLKSVESWVQVTHNSLADFYPDVWLASGSQSTFGAVEVKTALIPKTTQSTNWPANPEQLVFVWQDVLAENKLADNSLLGFTQLGVTPKERARFNRFLEMDLNKAGFLAAYPSRKAMIAIKKADGFGLEFLFTPDATTTDNVGSIIRLQDNAGDILGFSQTGRNLTLEIPGIKDPGQLKLTDFLQDHRPEHIFLSILGKQVKIYSNGRLLKNISLAKDPFSSRQDCQLLFGQPEKTGTGVNGALSHIALYGNAPKEQIILQNSQLVTGALEARPDVETIRFKGKLVEVSKVPEPDSLGAYRQALVVNRYQITGQQPKGYPEKEILVAQWAVLDRAILPETKDFKVGWDVKMNVEKFDLHPELEGERLMMDMFDPDLDLYYQIGD